jgi:hypothetical protein
LAVGREGNGAAFAAGLGAGERPPSASASLSSSPALYAASSMASLVDVPAGAARPLGATAAAITVRPSPGPARSKALSSSTAARASRVQALLPPNTTAIRRRLSRCAVTTMLKPEARMKPVLMPSTPS